MKPIAFPNPDHLCESCGYPLRDMHADQTCPECGTPLIDSHPKHRFNPPWLYRLSFRNWLGTFQLLRHPKSYFRSLTLVGNNAPPRILLLSVSVLAMLIWLIAEAFTRNPDFITFARGWLYAILIAKGILLMTYIEVLGLTFFSRGRGFRMPMRLAERIACYASPMWLPGIFLAAALYVAWERGVILSEWMQNFPANQLWMLKLLPVLGVIVVVFPYEMMIWLAVRQVRWANQ